MLVLLSRGLPRDSNVLRPIMTVWFKVRERKRCMSSGICQGSLPSFPITLFSETAAMIIISGMKHHGHSNSHPRTFINVSFKELKRLDEQIRERIQHEEAGRAGS